MGYYIFKINKNKYLTNFEYFEKLVNKAFFTKKNNRNFLANNELERELFNEPKKVLSKIY